MKKIILLIITCFLLSGCYDNIELNDLAIVSSIGIDYQNNNFILTYEILNDVQTKENSANLSYTITDKGKNIANAFTNTSYKTGKKAYFSHLKIAIISEEVAKNKLKEITDYLLRNIDITDQFQLIIAQDTIPEEILKHNSEYFPVVGELLSDLLENDKYNNNLAISDSFQKHIGKLSSGRQDIILNSVTIKNNEITLSNSYIFHNYNSVNCLSLLDSSIYNLLSKNTFAVEFQNKDNFTIKINNSMTKIDIKHDKIIINTKLEAKIIENDNNYNLKDFKVYQKLEKDFTKIIKNDIKKFIKILQKNKSDILGLQDKYYKKYRVKNNNLWEHAQINVKVNLKINMEGFIFKVENEK